MVVVLASPTGCLWAKAPVMREMGRGDPANMKGTFGLSDDQVAKLKSIRESEETALNPLRQKAKSLTYKLQEQVQSKAKDADIQATLNDLKANHNVITDQTKHFQSQ